jgi:predicted nuclease with RNAse H fold
MLILDSVCEIITYATSVISKMKSTRIETPNGPIVKPAHPAVGPLDESHCIYGPLRAFRLVSLSILKLQVIVIPLSVNPLSLSLMQRHMQIWRVFRSG